MSESKPSSAVHVARGASYIFLQNVAMNAMMVVSFSILARLITPIEMGAMAVLLMVIGASRVLACLGMQSSVTKFIAGSMAKNDRAAAAGVFYQAIRTNLLLSLPIAVAVFWQAEFLSMRLLGMPGSAVLFQVLALDMLVAAGLLPALNSAMLGLQKIKEMSMINLAYMATRQSLIVALTFATRSLLGLVVAWVVSELVVSLAFLTYLRFNIGPFALTFDLKRLVKFSFPLFLQDVANYAYTWFDRVALLTYLPLASLGIYTTAMTAFGVLSGVAAAAGTSLFPAYSTLEGRHGSQVLSDSIKGATRYLCLIGAPLSFGLFSTAKPSLALFVGEAYAEGTLPLMVVSLFFAFTLTSTALAYLPVVLGETMLSFKLTTLNIMLGIASTLVLLPSLGMVGASIARGITMTTSLITMMIALRSRIRFRIDLEAFWKSLISSGLMAAVVLLVQAHYYSKYLLPAYVALGGAVYFSILLLLRAIKTQDVKLLGEYLGSRFRFIVQQVDRLTRLARSD